MTRTDWPLLRVRLSVDYPARPGVLADASFEVRRGEIVGLVGSSGSGKSTLALSVLRLLEYKGGRASGTVRFKGRDLMQASAREMRSVRGREMAFVPQSPASYLNPAVRIGDQMEEAWKAHRGGSHPAAMGAIGGAMEQVGLPGEPSFLKRFPGEISLGQAQRVLIAMATLHRPALLIADEPTSSLDTISQAGILRLLARLNQELEMGILYISHDLLSIANFCHRVAILHEGRIVECAATAAIFEAPQHCHTRQLLAALPALPHFPEGRMESIPVAGGPRLVGWGKLN